MASAIGPSVRPRASRDRTEAMRRRMMFAVLCLGLSAVSVARAGTQAGVSIEGAWIRVLTPQIPAGGYFTLRNGSANPLVLTGARSPDCGMLMLHQSSDTGGMESMREVGNLKIPPGGTLTFAPGSYHLMCMDPSADMTPGGTAPVTLEFVGGQTIVADFAVRGARGR